jgi:Fe2+ or Zn2+ uptake regulation protein
VAAEILAERGHAPTSAEVVAVLRKRFGISRATAYRALR